MVVAYNIGERHGFTHATMPTSQMQMVVGPDGIARPYLMQASQGAFGQPLVAQPYGWAPSTSMMPAPGYSYATYPATYQQQAPYPVQTQTRYVTDRVAQPTVRRASSTRVESSEAQPRRSWQKSALLIGGSAGAGAGVGALMGGKKGALAGAAIGGGAAAIYDQVKRR
jgi:hypothetical protein